MSLLVQQKEIQMPCFKLYGMEDTKTKCHLVNQSSCKAYFKFFANRFKLQGTELHFCRAGTRLQPTNWSLNHLEGSDWGLLHTEQEGLWSPKWQNGLWNQKVHHQCRHFQDFHQRNMWKIRWEEMVALTLTLLASADLLNSLPHPCGIVLVTHGSCKQI